MDITNYITVNTPLQASEDEAIVNRRRLEGREDRLVSLGRGGWSLLSTVTVIGVAESRIVDTLTRSVE